MSPVSLVLSFCLVLVSPLSLSLPQSLLISSPLCIVAIRGIYLIHEMRQAFDVLMLLLKTLLINFILLSAVHILLHRGMDTSVSFGICADIVILNCSFVATFLVSLS